MKRTRDGDTVVAPDDLRSRLLQELQPLVSPLLFVTLTRHSTEALMNYLAQIRAPQAKDSDASCNR